MSYIVTNAVPILAAALVALVFGAAWYGLLARPRTANASTHKPSPSLIVLTFLCEAWIAAILAGALILAPVEAGRWTVALGSAGIIWVGFVAPVIAVDHRRRGLSWAQTAIDAGHWLGAMLLMAAVLRAVGVEGPASASSATPLADAPVTATLAGEWRVASVDGREAATPMPLRMKAGDQIAQWEPECAQLMFRYTVSGQDFRAHQVRYHVEQGADPREVVRMPCAMGLPPGLESAMAAMTAGRSVERVSDDVLRVSGNGRDLTLERQLPAADDGQPELSATLAPGEYRLAAADGREASLGHAITVLITDREIALFSQCVTPRWRYRWVEGRLVTDGIPQAICDRGRYPAESAAEAVFDAPERIVRTPGNGVRITGGGRSVTLFAQ